MDTGKDKDQPMKRELSEPIQVLTVCGVGMGSSLILRTTVEKAFEELGIEAKVEATDLSSARGMKPDIVMGQGMHMSELEGMAPIILTITNFVNVKALKEKLVVALREQGWM